MLIGMEESLLDQIIRIIVILGEPKNGFIDPLLVTPHKLCKRIDIAFSGFGHQFFFRKPVHFALPFH
jgi:hypothetical protein